jgi:hypothetical protein
MFRLFGTKAVDHIVSDFVKAINKLDDRAEDMKELIKAEHDVIEFAKERQKKYAYEGVRAETIAKKLRTIIE